MFVLTLTTFAEVPPICDGINHLTSNTSEILYPNSVGWYGKIGFAGGQFDASPTLGQARTYTKSVSCQPAVSNTYCVQSKGKANCAEFYTASVLTDIKNKLAGGGYNCFSRHERTYWQQYSGESGCKKNANCVELLNDPIRPWLTTSRYLAPWGHQASVYSGDALRSLGLNDTVDRAASSPFPRCLVNLQHSFPSATSDELLMYTGSIYENIKRKELCGTKSWWSKVDVQNAVVTDDAIINELIFDGLRKLAGTPPATGKNSFYNTHGFNMKGAFGQQIDEGYMMCFKPTDISYPISSREHAICLCDDDGQCSNSQPTVDFTGVKTFGLDFILSSEALLLMKELTDAAPKTGIYADGQVSESEVSAAAFTKLMSLQANVISATKVSIPAPNAFHMNTWAHVNAGYRDNVLQTVHVPFRNVLENSITSQAQFAVVKAIVDHSGGVDYNCTADTAVKSALAKCYTHGAEPSWYWGGEDKASIHAQHAYTNPKTYGDIAWKGNLEWFDSPYASEFVDAAACLVASGNVGLSTLMTSMGCASQFESCDDVKVAYQSSQCCGTDGSRVSVVAS